MLLSLKFRENLEQQIEMYGDYSTMMWFQDHDIIMSESALIAVAKRGDLGLFRAIINDYEEVVRVSVKIALKSSLILILRLQKTVT